MSQKLEGGASIDWARTGRMTAWGAMFAPLAHAWYLKLDQWIPGAGAAVVAKKVAADQVRGQPGSISRERFRSALPAFLYTAPSPPSCPRCSLQLTWTIAINATFFFTTTLMATGDPGKGVTAVTEKMWPTLKVNWLVWPFLTGFNLAMVPLNYRILFINGCSLFWSAFLSNMTNKGTAAPAAPIAVAPPAAAAAQLK